MNLPRKTVFWVLTFVAFAGGFHLIDEKAEDVKRAEEAKLRLFPFEPQDVKEFWISDNGGSMVKVVMEGEEWRLTKPKTAKADKDIVEKTLRNIVKARKDAVLFVDPEPSKLEELGLDVADLEVGLITESGGTAIRFGDKGPTHNVTYAMLEGDPRVYRVHSDVKKEANKSSYDLRDKSIFIFDPLKLRRLQMEQEGADRIVIEHEEGRWNIIEPRLARAEMAKVLEVLYKIKNAQIKAFIDEEPSGPGNFGLASPRIKVSILEDEGDSARTLLVGEKDRKRRGYFARVDESDAVFVIEESLVDSLLVSMKRWAE